MAQLNQMQLRFDPNEDRLLLRVNTTDRREFRFWVTRRYARLLWSALTRSLSSQERIRRAVDAPARRAILAFEHERALQRANFSKTFDERPAEMPFGETPILLVRIQTKKQKDGRRLLGLHPKTGRGLNLLISPEMAHGFMRLLTDAVAKTDWNLKLPRPGSERAPQRPAVVN
jgi:hypothetical protein